MRYVATQTIAGTAGTFKEGDEITDVPDELVEQWLADGLIAEAPEPADEAKAEKSEPASAKRRRR